MFQSLPEERKQQKKSCFGNLLSLLMRDLSEARSSLAREARKSVVCGRVLSWPGEAAAAAAVGSLW